MLDTFILLCIIINSFITMYSIQAYTVFYVLDVFCANVALRLLKIY